MEITEDFLKILQLAVIILGVIGIFFTYIYYNVIVNSESKQREAVVLGDALLGSTCLTETYFNTPMKGLFLESKLDSFSTSCVNFPDGQVNIKLLDGSKSWSFQFSSTLSGISTSPYYVAVKLSSGRIVPARLDVTV